MLAHNRKSATGYLSAGKLSLRMMILQPMVSYWTGFPKKLKIEQPGLPCKAKIICYF
jgi:hypothetical protein